MPDHKMKYAAALLAVCAGSVQATDYVKLSGSNVDFYYDADVWTLGATVTGNSISVRSGDIYQRADVTEGAADPYQGPVYTAQVDFTRSFSQSLIAVAHTGYNLNNNISSTAQPTLTSSSVIGAASYSLDQTYHRGQFGGAAFTAAGAIGSGGEWAYFYRELYTGGSDSGSVPLVVTTPFTSHAAIAVDGAFRGFATATGLGTAAAGLSGIDYSFGVSAVPEPQQYVLMGAGMVLLGAAARRRKRLNS